MRVLTLTAILSGAFLSGVAVAEAGESELTRYTISLSNCYRLEQPLAGWDSHPLKINAFARRTDKIRKRPSPRHSQGGGWACGDIG